MDVSDLHAEVPLPRSAEKLLDEICAKHNLPPADAELRRKLASAGEDRALQVLRTIADSTTKVRSLPGFATHLFRQSPSPPPPPQSSPSRSPAPENPRPYDSPGTLITNSPGTLITNSPARRNGGEAPEMEALGELEFRKQFLILNYIGGNELQSVTTAEEIRSLKPLSMVQFEKQYHDWESGKTHKYHCHVSPEGSYRFKGPYVEKTKTHLQKVIGDDNVLMVKFAEEAAAENFSVGSRDQNYAGYSKICREVFKDGGKEEKKKDPTSSPVKCYFVRINSNAWIDQSASYILSNRTISEARHLFMHARTVSTVSNYMVRFSLILSKTLTLKIDLSSVNIDIIEDEYCQDKSGNRIYRDGKPLIHTDGTGFISEDLALLCPKNLYRGKFVDDQNNKVLSSPIVIRLHYINFLGTDYEILHTRDEREDNVAVMEHRGTETLEPPLLMQFRMFNQGHAVKGTCLVNRKLELKTIKIRRSMVKVEPDPELSNYQTANSLEIVGTSNPPKKTHLSRNLIALLSCGGVPEKYFKHLVWNTLRESHGAFNSKRTAIRVAINQGGLDNGSIVARMILSGIPLEEPFLQHRLSVLVKEERKGLRGGKLSVDDCFYLMGTADPTGKLEHDEVCIILANGQVSGKVLVYRNPGLHFGDIHVLKATYIEEEELESFVGNAKYAIFFSRKGPRSIADEIATGDFDGDMYWVSRNPEVWHLASS
ncbi:hypothetical protein TIFTF001_019770 [Ficus carica]|uniref:RNA-dependent RNA polymerase n=1 Tax=Ficus carica TaxID=3494 RepID=A0AA88ACB2_FICCA|nr:hypothetical protein TIFTF001_019770 [Ficus carica]